MTFPSLERSLDKVSNRYLLVVLAAKRARQLNRGAQAQLEIQAQEAHQRVAGGDRRRQGGLPSQGRGRPQGPERVALGGTGADPRRHG